MARTATVTLGGREYEVRALPFRANQRWRGRLGETFEGLIEAIEQGPGTELSDLGSIGRMMRQVRDLAMGSVGQMLDLVCEYAPGIASERERIEAEAYDEEIVDAFLEVVKLAFPFGRVVATFRGLAATVS